jgi:hypothetical protein
MGCLQDELLRARKFLLMGIFGKALSDVLPFVSEHPEVALAVY